jgi:uncharacterized membrane protein YgaE (UPF0421/DUF939 family)
MGCVVDMIMGGSPGGSSRTQRAEEALEALTQFSRQGVRERLRRLRHTALPIVQCAVGAALAWWVATGPLIDHERPFFAPIAALISVGVGLGQRLPRVVELVVGVALGVLIGDLLVAWIGTGIAQIALVVALAMVAAVVLGGGAVIVTQAGASAVLVATLTTPGGDLDLDRFIDALVGGVVGLIVSAVLLPVNPVAAVRRELDPLLGTLAELIDDCAEAIAERDRAGAALALGRARETQDSVDAMREALEGSSEVALIAPARWRARGQLTGYLDAADPIDHVSRDLRVMARHVVSMLRRNEPVPSMLPQALRALAGAVRLLRIDLARGEDPVESRANAIAAAELATEALDETGGFAGQVVVAQTRSLAVDVLRATGLEREKALGLLPSLPPGPVSYG